MRLRFSTLDSHFRLTVNIPKVVKDAGRGQNIKMQFRFSTLENVKTAELLDAFNAAFADYFIKIEFDEKALASKLAAENLSLKTSVGAFFEDKLAGFILLGIDDFGGRKTAYNGGTGVVPEFRGNALTEKMYDFILPILKKAGAQVQLLEVVTKNIAALKTYEKIGFRAVRPLSCFQGKIAPSEINKNLELKFLDDIDARRIKPFWNSPPGWQNSLSAIRRARHKHKIIGAFDRSIPIGYIAFTQSGRVKQFGVKKDFRHKGVAQTLFARLKNEIGDKELTVNNIDKTDAETIAFLNKTGLKIYLEQFEMRMEI